MIRLIAIAALVSLMVRVVFGRWPWEYMATPPTREQALFRARRLLEVDAGASADQIRMAHRRKIAATHPDRGGNNAASQELNAARDLLLEDIPQ